MNQTVNKVMLLGYVADEPEKQIIKGKHLLFFTVITPEQIKRGEETTLHEEHHRIQIEERLSAPDVIKKGNMVYVQGKVHTRPIIGSDNVKRYHTEIIANSVEQAGTNFPKL